MAKTEFEVEERTISGSTACRRLRREGKVPANVFGLDRPPFSVQLEPQRIEEVLRSKSGQNTILTLSMVGRDVRSDVRIIELQRDPVTERVIHVDFVRVDPTVVVTVEVPVHLIGVPLGVRNEGGVLDFVHRELNISCLPDRIPTQFDIDVSELHLNQHVSASDIEFGEGIVLEDDENTIIATVAAPRVEEVEEPEADEEADADAAATDAEGGDKDAEPSEGSEG